EQKGSQAFCPTIERSVAFHANDSVSDDKVRANCRADVENALVNSGPVENILRPAVPAAWDNTKHVFHAERDAGPVVRLHLRHGHDEVRCEDGSREPEMSETGIVGLELCLDELVAIQINKPNLAVRELIGETGLV